MDIEPDEVQQFWEQHYAEADRVWSGRVNTRLVEVASGMTPGWALDLGCGEGADALWLAEKGWQVVAVDVSATALRRATVDARRRKLLDRIDFQRHDLSVTFPEGTFDLVSAQYLQSPVRLDRDVVLRKAAGSLNPGGVLLIVDHASAPPWARHNHHHFPGTEEVLAPLRLDETCWRPMRVEATTREAVGPEGQVATVTDNVIVLRRDG
jgi:SAM-dependent methyltransferase